MARRVLVVQAGSIGPEVSRAVGDFDAWFARLLAPRVEVAVALPAALPAPDAADGVLVTGSLASVAAPEPWMAALGAWLLEAARRRPVLGVCFGHQLLAHALGGRVERNPRGVEAGTCLVHLTPAGRADPLLAGLPDPLPVQQTHEDHVPEPPPGAVLLAGSDLSPVQAFAHGASIRAVQFHPEIDLARARLLAGRARRDHDRRAPGGSARVRASLRETPEAERVLSNWLARFVGA